MKKMLVVLVLCVALFGGDFEKGEAAYGRGDYYSAVKYFKKAANQGDSAAQYNLGYIYFVTDEMKDYTKAAYWFEKSANQEVTQAQRFIALLYIEGKGVKQDYKKAVYWLEKAIDNGYTDSQELLDALCSKYPWACKK